MIECLVVLKRVIQPSKKIFHYLFIPTYVLVVLGLVQYSVVISFVCGSLYMLIYSNIVINGPYLASDTDSMRSSSERESLRERMMASSVMWAIGLLFMIISYSMFRINAYYDPSLTYQNFSSMECIILMMASTTPFLALSEMMVVVAYRYKRTIAPAITVILSCFMVLPIVFLFSYLQSDMLWIQTDLNAMVSYAAISIISLVLFVYVSKTVENMSIPVVVKTDYHDCGPFVIYSDSNVEKIAKSISKKLGALITTAYQFVNTQAEGCNELYIVITRRSYKDADMGELLQDEYDRRIKKIIVVCSNFTVEGDTCRREVDFISSVLKEVGIGKSICILSGSDSNYAIDYISDRFDIRKSSISDAVGSEIVIYIGLSSSGVAGTFLDVIDFV